MQDLRDDLLGNGWPVRVGSVDEVGAQLDRTPEHIAGVPRVLRRAPDAGTG